MGTRFSEGSSSLLNDPQWWYWQIKQWRKRCRNQLELSDAWQYLPVGNQFSFMPGGRSNFSQLRFTFRAVTTFDENGVAERYAGLYVKLKDEEITKRFEVAIQHLENVQGAILPKGNVKEYIVDVKGTLKQDFEDDHDSYAVVDDKFILISRGDNVIQQPFALYLDLAVQHAK